MERFDVAVIGGGVLGCFAARELSRRKLDIVLLGHGRMSAPASPVPTLLWCILAMITSPAR